MIPAIDVPAAASATSLAPPASAATRASGGSSAGASVSNHIREEEPFEEEELVLGPKSACYAADANLPRLFEKSVIIHRDENGFGLRLKGQAPVFVEHVHENGAAWRAGVRRLDRISKVNGTTISNMDHKDVILMFKSCTRFVGLTLLSQMTLAEEPSLSQKQQQTHQRCLGLVPTSSVPTAFNFSSLSPNQKLFARQLYPVAGGTRRAYNRAASQSLIGSIPSALTSGANTSYKNISSQPHHLQQDSNRLQTASAANGCPQPACIQPSSQLSRRRIEADETKQQLAARRSESISFRPSYSPGTCSSSQQHSGSLNRQQVFASREIRRTSADEALDSDQQLQQEPGQFDLSSRQPVSVCINCRTAISKSHQEASSSAGSTCLQCQIKFGQRQEQQQQRFESIHQAEPTKQQMVAEHQRQRSYGSLKDQKQQELELAIPRNQNEAQQHQQQQQPQQHRQPYFKLNQSGSTSSLPADTSGLPRQPTTNKRLEIIREFIDTEMTHTERLRCLDELFYRPLKTGGFMTTEQLRMVFSCHRTLYKIHRQIYRILLSANYNSYTTEPMIGSALLEIFEGDLKRRLERASCSFCVAQSANADLLNKLTRRDTKVGEFLAQVTSQQMVGRLGIKDLLASCFQRLTKYPLLLENLLKATPLPEPVESRKVARSGGAIASSAVASDDLKEEEEEEEEGDNVEGEENEFEDEEELEKIRNSRRMLAISLAEEREFIERALLQSRQILVRVNESVKVAASHNKLKEIWKRTDKYPGVPLIDITKEQVVHEGLLTLRLSKRSFDVYVLLLNNYIIILTRESQDKYRLKFFTPEGKSSASNSQSVYSPVFVIDEHLTTRDAATDENGFYLLCKRKDDSRIYEFASRSPAERLKWRDRIQWTIERQMSKSNRRPSCESSITKSSLEISTRQETEDQADDAPNRSAVNTGGGSRPTTSPSESCDSQTATSSGAPNTTQSRPNSSIEPTKIEGTISYVEDDGIVMPSKMESSWALVDQAIQVNVFDSLRKPVPSN